MNTTLQTRFLSSLIANKVPVAVYLRHGIKLKGRLVGFDEKILFLADAQGVQLILKDSVSTVTPIYEIS